MKLSELKKLIEEFGNVSWLEIRDVLKAKGYACYVGETNA